MSSENFLKLSKLGSKVKIRSWSISIAEVAEVGRSWSISISQFSLFLCWVKIRVRTWMNKWVPCYVGWLRSRHVLSPCKSPLVSGASQKPLKECSDGTSFHPTLPKDPRNRT